MELDTTDWQILRLLQSDARISNVDLAKQVGLSPSPCLSRVRALEKSGFISRYVSLLDPLRVGLKVSVFIQVTLEKQIEYVAWMREVPGLSASVRRLGAYDVTDGAEEPAVVASGVEFLLEGLHLARRLNKDRIPGGTVYHR